MRGRANGSRHDETVPTSAAADHVRELWAASPVADGHGDGHEHRLYHLL